jgi:hypothetical protein
MGGGGMRHGGGRRGGGGEAGGSGGGWGGRGGGRHGGEDGSAAGRAGRLPDLMRVAQTGTTVSFEDSAGVAVREDTGEWKGDKLVVHRAGPRDSKITETISLEDKGKSLKIDTKIESSGGDMSPREFKRVYSRAT